MIYMLIIGFFYCLIQKEADHIYTMSSLNFCV